MSTDTSTSLEVTSLIKADADTVFRAWTEPDQMKRWSCPEYATVEKVETDLRVGGRFAIHMRGAEGEEYTAIGEYREIDAPSRLVYTWDWVQDEHKVGETIVTVQFNEVGGSTEVVVGHELFPRVEAKVGHEEGWGSCLNRLEALFS